MPGKRRAALGPDDLVCRDCQTKFKPKDGKYKRVADGILCRDRPTCRSRVLSKVLGIDLFTQYPRERLYYEMDVRPADYKKTKWKPIFTEDERVMAAWIYFSWCYPVCLPYAVQIDPDDELITDRYAQPLVMTQQRLGQFLGMSQQSISRATIRLARRKKLRIEDGQVYPESKPVITPDARLDISTDVLSYIGEAPKTIPPKFRHRLNDLLAEAPEDIRSDVLATALKFCTDYNEAHKDIRTTRDEGLEQVCTDLASLLSRPITLKEKRAGGSYTTRPDGPPAPNPPVEGLGQAAADQEYAPAAASPSQRSAAEALYAGIPALQERFPRAPFSRPRFTALGKADRQLAYRILDALKGEEVAPFLTFVEDRLKQGRTMNKLGLLPDWAQDWAADAPRRREEAEALRREETEQEARSVAAERALAAEAELDTLIDEAWEQMPDAERAERLSTVRAEVKAMPWWKNLPPAQREPQVEQYAKRRLRHEMRPRGKGVGGDD